MVSTQAMLRIREQGAPAVADWKRFLAAGGTEEPAAMAAIAGVDVTTDAALVATIDYIGSLIDEICRLTEEIDGIVI